MNQTETATQSHPTGAANPQRVGFAGFQAYGNVAGAHGPWKTHDGKDMPTWDGVGPLTQARWVAAGETERAAVLAQVRAFSPEGAAIADALEAQLRGAESGT